VVPSIRAKFGGPGTAEKGHMVSAPPEMFVRNGTIFLQLRLFEPAIHAFQTALQHDLPVEGRAASLNNLGLAFLNTGQRGDARRCFLEASTLNPSSVEIRNNLASLEADTTNS